MVVVNCRWGQWKKKQDKEFIPWHLTKNFDSLSLHTPYLQAFFFVTSELDKAKEGKSIVQKEFQRDLKGISPRNIV